MVFCQECEPGLLISFAIYSFTASRVNDAVDSFEQTINEAVVVLQAVSELDPKDRDKE